MALDTLKKLRPLYILDYLKSYSDDRGGLTEREIHDRLFADLGIDVDRRHIYEDIHALQEFGFDIIKIRRPEEYCLINREFTLAELKLLVDAVESSRFITKEASAELISKLEKFCSAKDARALARTVWVQNRIKSANESGYENVDRIYEAISDGRQISFAYFNYDQQKRKRYKRSRYQVSPYAMVWSDGNYYLIAWDSVNSQIRHYRVDKIEKIRITDLPREGQDAWAHTDTAIYQRSLFGMFGGKLTGVRLRCHNSMAGVIIDRFGAEPTFFPTDKEHFEVSVSVVPSPQFYGWIFGLSGKVQIVSPDSAVTAAREYIEKIAAGYR